MPNRAVPRKGWGLKGSGWSCETPSMAPVTSHGTRCEEHAGRLTRVIDRNGAVHATLTWRGDHLEALEVPGAIVRGAVIVDALFGRAQAIERPPGGLPLAPRLATTLSAIDWARPTEIPAIAAPARIPAGAAAPIMNVLALLAARAGIPALRYAGPYPTHALWRTLLRSFRTGGTADQFTADALDRAARIARDPIALDVHPDPHERIAIEHGHVELRRGIERVVIYGVAYVPEGSPARLVTDGSELRAEVWVGDDLLAHVATFAADGTVLAGPYSLRPYASGVIGRAFPPALRSALADLVADAVPAPLAAAAHTMMASRPIRWADLGARIAAHDHRGFAVHAALWDRIAPLGLARLALAMTEALAPIVAGEVTIEAAAVMST